MIIERNGRVEWKLNKKGWGRGEGGRNSPRLRYDNSPSIVLLDVWFLPRQSEETAGIPSSIGRIREISTIVRTIFVVGSCHTARSDNLLARYYFAIYSVLPRLVSSYSFFDAFFFFARWTGWRTSCPAIEVETFPSPARENLLFMGNT